MCLKSDLMGNVPVNNNIIIFVYLLESFCLVEDVCYDCLQLPGCGWCNDECKPLEECSDQVGLQGLFV